MSALMIIDLKVKDIEKLKEYSSQTPAILQKYNGELLCKGKPSTIHGQSDVNFDTTVVFQFPTKNAALEWYNSPEYKALLSVRDEAMDSVFKILA